MNVQLFYMQEFKYLETYGFLLFDIQKTIIEQFSVFYKAVVSCFRKQTLWVD